MQAALITGERTLELVEFPEPTPTDGGVVVDVTYCGICGTDVGAYATGRPYRPSLCGHEWTGVVSALGAGVTGLSEADRVVVAVPQACGECGPCRSGHPAHCAVVVDVIHGRDAGAPVHGGFAPRIAVPAGRVLRAHPALDDETLAQVEPVTICVHAVERSGIHEGDSVVVIGAGAVGLTALQCAAAAGAGDVIVVEPDDSRRSLAGRLAMGSAAETTSVDPAAAPDVVAARTAGMGADVVLDCAGGTEALAQAVALARRGGTVCMVGLSQGPVSIQPAEWLRKEITVTAAIGYRHEDFDRAMQLLADGAIDVSQLHTSTARLEGLADIFENLATGRSDQVKVLVDPNWPNPNWLNPNGSDR